MATYVKFYQFAENLGKGVHNFTSDATCSVTVALTTNANLPALTAEVLATVTEISYTNCSSRVVTGVTWEQSTGTVTMTATDLVLTASGTVGPFQHVILYDDDPTSPADPLIGMWDHGTEITMSSGQTFTLDFITGITTLA